MTTISMIEAALIKGKTLVVGKNSYSELYACLQKENAQMGSLDLVEINIHLLPSDLLTPLLPSLEEYHQYLKCFYSPEEHQFYASIIKQQEAETYGEKKEINIIESEASFSYIDSLQKLGSKIESQKHRNLAKTLEKGKIQ